MKEKKRLSTRSRITRSKKSDEEIEGLRARLAEAEETLRAIREGEVDAVIVSGSKGDRVFSLTETENMHRLLVETMGDAGLATTPDGIVVYSNGRLSSLLSVDDRQILGHSLFDFVEDAHADALRALYLGAQSGRAKARVRFQSGGNSVSMHLSASQLQRPDGVLVCFVGTDLTEIEADRELIRQLEEQREALRLNEERYRHLVKNAPAGIYELDFRTGRFTEVNDAMCGILGYTREELLSMSALEILDDDGKSRFKERIRSGQSGERPDESVEYRVRKKDGIYIWGFLNSKFHFEGAKIVGATVVAHDITDRKRMEEELRESKAMLQAVMQNTSDPIYVKDAESRILMCNPALERVTGKPADQIVGKTDTEYYEDEAIGKALREHDLNVMKSGRSLSSEETVQTRDGERTFISNKAPYRDASGTIIGIVGISHDITERKLGEEALRLSEEKFAAAFTNNPSAVALTRLDDGLLLDVNSAWEEMTGYMRNEVIGRSGRDLGFWRTSEAANRFIREIREKGLVRGWEQEFLRRSGEVFTGQFSAQAITVRGEKAILTTMVDVTERNRADEEARRSEARFRSVLDNSRDVIYRLNVQSGRYEYISPSCASVVGFTPEELMGMDQKTSLEMIHPDDLPEVSRMMARATETGEGNLEYRQRAKNGDYRWISNQVSVTRNEAGRPLYRDGSIRDTTERRREQEALRLSEEKFAIAFAGNPAAIALSRLDDGLMLDVNDTWVELEGYSREEIVGKSARALGIWPTAESAARFVGELRKNGSVRGWEEEFRKKSGEIFTAQLSAQVITIRGEKLILSTLVDITERRRAEKQTELTLAKFYSALSNMYGSILVVTDDGKVEFANRAFVELFDLKRDPKDLVGVGAAEIIAMIKNSYVEPERSVLRIGEIVARGEAVKGEEVYLTGGRTCLRDFIPLKVGEVSFGRLWHHIDITDRKRAEEALRESELTYRMLVNSIPDTSIMLFDRDLRFQIVGGEENEKNSFDKSLIEGKTLREAYPTDVANLFEPLYRKALSGEPVSFEMSYGPYEYSQQTIPIKDDKGQILAAMQIATNITERKQAEEALSQSRKTFVDLVEGAPFGMYIIDSEFRIAHMNVSSQNGAFRNVRPVIGRHFSEAMHILWNEPVASEILASFRHTLESGEPYYSPRFTNPRHDVEATESYEWELHRLVLPSGGYGVVCYYFDSTKLREAESALRESEDRFRTIAEALPVYISLSSLEDSKILYTNSAYNEAFGYHESEIVGRPGPDVYYDPADRDKMLAKIRKHGFVHNYSLKAKRRDGTPLWILSDVRPITYQGKPAILGASIDITARRKAEEELQSSEQKFLTMFRSAPVGLSLATFPDGTLFDVNQAWLDITGFASKEEVIGKNTLELGLIVEREHRGQIIDKSLRDGSLHNVEMMIQTKTGVRRTILVNVDLIEIGGSKYILSTNQDITERKEAEEDLSRFNRVAVGRELQMIELKKEINELCRKAGEMPRYDMEFREEGS